MVRVVLSLYLCLSLGFLEPKYLCLTKTTKLLTKNLTLTSVVPAVKQICFLDKQESRKIYLFYFQLTVLFLLRKCILFIPLFCLFMRLSRCRPVLVAVSVCPVHYLLCFLHVILLYGPF